MAVGTWLVPGPVVGHVSIPLSLSLPFALLRTAREPRPSTGTRVSLQGLYQVQQRHWPMYTVATGSWCRAVTDVGWGLQAARLARSTVCCART